MSLIPEQIDESQTELYVVESGNLRIGPLKASEIRAKIKAGSINSNSLAWEKGLSEWKKLNDPYWEKHGFVFQESDSQDTITIEGDDSTKYRWKLKETKEAATKVGIGSKGSQEKDLYLLKIELGWWEKLLEEIQKQDLIEELGDITYLNEQKERILKLSEELREKGLLEGTAGEFIAKEYHLFDKSAEKVEEEIRRLGLKLKSNEFLMDFLNSTEFVSKDEIFVPITDAIHALCRKFAQDNGHRIIGQDNLDIWKLFGDKYGESEDIPLLCDLVKIGNRKPGNPELFDDLSSPVLLEVGKSIKLLKTLLKENSQLQKGNYSLLKKLQDFSSNHLIEEMVEKKEKVLLESEIKINFESFQIETMSQNQKGLTKAQYNKLCIENERELTSLLETVNAEKVRLEKLRLTLETDDQVLQKLQESKINESLKLCEKKGREISDKITEQKRRLKLEKQKSRDNKIALVIILGALVLFFIVSRIS